MMLLEMFDPPIAGYQNLSDDNSKPALKQSRKTKLTLKQIRLLRLMLDVRNFERLAYLKQVQAQYGTTSQGSPGGIP